MRQETSGGEYGKGAMRIHGKSADYYNVVAGSIGWQICAEAKDMILVFRTEEAPKNFRVIKGWEAGVDGNVAAYLMGAGDGVRTTMKTADPHKSLGFEESLRKKTSPPLRKWLLIRICG